MALIEVTGALKLEPSVLKSEPGVVEIYPADIFHSSDEEDLGLTYISLKHDYSYSRKHKVLEDDYETEEDISENEIAVHDSKDKVKNGDTHRDTDFCVVENLRGDERLLLNFNENDDTRENSNSEEVNWANVYRTYETTCCLEDQKKVKKIYGPSWSKPIHHKEYTYKTDTSVICNYCNHEFKGMRYLTRHIKTLHRESSIIHQCPYCPHKSKWNLRDHILEKHKNENEITWFQCYQCGKKFRLKSHLIRHIQRHYGMKSSSTATCPTCQRVFSSEKHVKVHIRIYHEEKRFRCEKCSFAGQYLSSLKNHMEALHTDPNQLPILQCTKCKFKTRYKHLFTKHCKRHEITYFCDRCAFTTVHSASFKLHENVHKNKTDNKGLRYHCKKCDYKAYRQYSLKVHELNHLKPEEIKYFYCYHCGFKAKRKDNLKTHVIRHFKNEEVTLQCFICDFKTKKRQKLMKHIRNHQKSPKDEE